VDEERLCPIVKSITLVTQSIKYSKKKEEIKTVDKFNNTQIKPSMYTAQKSYSK